MGKEQHLDQCEQDGCYQTRQSHGLDAEEMQYELLDSVPQLREELADYGVVLRYRLQLLLVVHLIVDDIQHGHLVHAVRPPDDVVSRVHIHDLDGLPGDDVHYGIHRSEDHGVEVTHHHHQDQRLADLPCIEVMSLDVVQHHLQHCHACGYAGDDTRNVYHCGYLLRQDEFPDAL